MYNKQFRVKMSDKTESQKAAKGKKGTRGEEKEVRTCIRTCAMKSLEPLIRSLFFFSFSCSSFGYIIMLLPQSSFLLL